MLGLCRLRTSKKCVGLRAECFSVRALCKIIGFPNAEGLEFRVQCLGPYVRSCRAQLHRVWSLGFQCLGPHVRSCRSQMHRVSSLGFECTGPYAR